MAEKLRGTKVWVPTPGRVRRAGCWVWEAPSRCEGSGVSPGWVLGAERPPHAVRVRGYHRRKIFEN